MPDGAEATRMVMDPGPAVNDRIAEPMELDEDERGGAARRPKASEMRRPAYCRNGLTRILYIINPQSERLYYID